MQIDTSRIFKTIDQCETPILVLSGGTSSSKTYSALQWEFVEAVKHQNIVCTVVGESASTIESGSWRDANEIMKDFEDYIVDVNNTKRIITFFNGSIIEFNSYKDVSSAKGGKRDRLFINEADNIPYDMYSELQMRCNGLTIIDHNPTYRYWAYTKLKGREDVTWDDSTFEDNPFLSDAVRKTIEGYEPTPENKKRGTADKWKWAVYGKGQLARRTGLVFNNFERAYEFPRKQDWDWTGYGMDFGYTADPTALVQAAMWKGDVYVRTIIYETGLLSSDISNKMHAADNLIKDRKIYCDDSDPRMYQELQDKGHWAVGASKGQINSGLDLMQQYNFKIVGSPKFHQEFSNYTWRTDQAGEATNEPIDKFNHAIDALRYLIINIVRQRELEIHVI